MAKSPSVPSCKAKALIVALLMAFNTHTCASSMEPSSSNFTFFMHDILGGVAPSERVVAGATVATVHNFPFAKPIHRILPIPAGIHLVDSNPNPSATTSTVISDIGTHSNIVIDNSNMLPYAKPGALPLGATLMDKVLFGRVTVIDYEVTQGPDLDSQVIGKAQGFHLATSWDGTSKTMAFTALFGDDEEDTVSFFGVNERLKLNLVLPWLEELGNMKMQKGMRNLKSSIH